MTSSATLPLQSVVVDIRVVGWLPSSSPRAGSGDYVHVDANVIVSRYKPGEPYHEGSERILTSGEVRRVSSDLTLVELASVVSRLYPARGIVLSPEAEGAIKGLSLTERNLAVVATLSTRTPSSTTPSPARSPSAWMVWR
ncbi:MAG: PIN domain-containing protein [Candidatus Bathyarchaeia archaeon]